MRISRLTQLPRAFTGLKTAAEVEGVRNMALLEAGFASGAVCFDGEGEALFAAWSGDSLSGVGGLTRERAAEVDAMRMRRFYVHPQARRLGAGRALAEAAIQAGLLSAPMITCNARASPAAAPFWEALGFAPESHRAWTHVLRRA